MTTYMSTILARHLRWSDLTIHSPHASELSGANVHNSGSATVKEKACPGHQSMLYKAERIATRAMDAQLTQQQIQKRANTQHAT